MQSALMIGAYMVGLVALAVMLRSNQILIRKLEQVEKDRERERHEMLNRLQARDLAEYEAVKQGPGRAIHKSMMQKASEQAERNGVTVASLRHPTQWSKW